jgi:hypothetical protein
VLTGIKEYQDISVALPVIRNLKHSYFYLAKLSCKGKIAALLARYNYCLSHCIAVILVQNIKPHNRKIHVNINKQNYSMVK